MKKLLPVPKTEEIGEKRWFKGVTDCFCDFFGDIDGVIDKGPSDNDNEKAVCKEEKVIGSGLI